MPGRNWRSRCCRRLSPGAGEQITHYHPVALARLSDFAAAERACRAGDRAGSFIRHCGAPTPGPSWYAEDRFEEALPWLIRVQAGPWHVIAHRDLAVVSLFLGDLDRGPIGVFRAVRLKPDRRPAVADHCRVVSGGSVPAEAKQIQEVMDRPAARGQIRLIDSNRLDHILWPRSRQEASRDYDGAFRLSPAPTPSSDAA